MKDHGKKRWLFIVLGCLQVFIGIGGVPEGLLFILDPSGTATKSFTNCID